MIFTTTSSQRKIRKPIFFFLFVISLLPAFFGCDKPDEIDIKSPDKKNKQGLFLSSDTFTVQMRTMPMVPVNTNNLTRDFLGTYYDSIFGTTRSSVFMNFNPPGQKIDTITIDSAHLRIAYGGSNAYFGNPGTRQTFKVYELTEELEPTKSYKSDFKLKHSTTPIGTWTGIPDPSKPYFTVNLTPDFVTRLNQASPTDFGNKDSFRVFFKGIVIIPDDSFTESYSGAIIYPNLVSDQTRIVLYSQGKSIGALKTDNTIGRYDHFYHNYQGAKAEKAIQSGYGYSQAYIQPMSGLKINLMFPTLENLVKEEGIRIQIHEAQLIFEYEQDYPYDAPERLLVFASNNKFENQFLVDQFEDSYGGNLDLAAKNYIFNIPLHTQYLINQYDEDPSFSHFGLNVIVPSDKPAIANPVIFSNRPQTKGVRLMLAYTKFKL